MLITQFVVLSTAILALFEPAHGQHEQHHRIDITTSVPDDVTLPGATVTITCRLIGMPSDTVFMMKKGAYLDLITHPITEDVALNAKLNTFYTNLNRFAISKTTESSDIIYILQISNITVEDSGYYGCTASADGLADTASSPVEIAVYRPPTVVEHNQNDSVIVIEEGKQIPLNCSAPRVFPYPNVEVWIADRDNRDAINPLIHGEDDPKPPTKEMIDNYRNTEKWRDVTEKFLVQSRTNTYCTENFAQKNCPLHLDYTMDALQTPNHVLLAKHDYHGKFLTCVVTMRELNRDSANTSVLLHVEHDPKITCKALSPKNRIPAEVDSTDFSVECNVRANPAPTDGEVSWIEGTCNSGTAITKDSQDYSFSEKVLVPDNTNRNVTLLFKKTLEDKYFQKRYCLRVRNARTATQQEFQLEKATSESTRMASTGLLYISAFLLALFLPWSRN